MLRRWVRCNTEKIHPKVEYLVLDLLKGCEYEFRVSAENVVGIGDPSPPSKPVFAKDPIGKTQKCQRIAVPISGSGRRSAAFRAPKKHLDRRTTYIKWL